MIREWPKGRLAGKEWTESGPTSQRRPVSTRDRAILRVSCRKGALEARSRALNVKAPAALQQDFALDSSETIYERVHLQLCRLPLSHRLFDVKLTPNWMVHFQICFKSRELELLSSKLQRAPSHERHMQPRALHFKCS